MGQNPINIQSVVCVSRDQVSCDLEGEKAILNASAGMYYGLQDVGSRVWDLIQKPKRVGAIKETLLQEYDVDAQRCERDLLNLLTDLADKGLIETHL